MIMKAIAIVLWLAFSLASLYEALTAKQVSAKFKDSPWQLRAVLSIAYLWASVQYFEIFNIYQ